MQENQEVNTASCSLKWEREDITSAVRKSEELLEGLMAGMAK